MNRIIAWLLVILMWLLAPIAILFFIVAISIAVFWAGSQLQYAYFLSELNSRRKKP